MNDENVEAVNAYPSATLTPAEVAQVLIWYAQLPAEISLTKDVMLAERLRGR